MANNSKSMVFLVKARLGPQLKAGIMDMGY